MPMRSAVSVCGGAGGAAPRAAASRSAASSSPRASIPPASSDKNIGKPPAVGPVPAVGSTPPTPQKLAGRQHDAPVSVPSEAKASPAATATAEPEDDAPLHRPIAQG